MNGKLMKTAMAVGLAAIMGLAALGGNGLMAQDEGQAVKAPAAKAQAKVRAPKTKAPPAAKVNLNSAGADQLQTLPKVGPKVAQRIVEYRNAHKGFKTVDELRNVKGVGPKTLELIRPYVTL
jgi:competence protein ComEA